MLEEQKHCNDVVHFHEGIAFDGGGDQDCHDDDSGDDKAKKKIWKAQACKGCPLTYTHIPHRIKKYYRLMPDYSSR